MSNSPKDPTRAEIYARSLIAEEQKTKLPPKDPAQLDQAIKFLSEVFETLVTMRSNNDLGLLDQVVSEYKNILDSKTDVIQVKCTTAVSMDDQLRQAVRVKLEKELNTAVSLVENVDPSILGGIVLEIRGDRYDAPTRAQLMNVKEALYATYFGSDV